MSEQNDGTLRVVRLNPAQSGEELAKLSATGQVMHARARSFGDQRDSLQREQQRLESDAVRFMEDVARFFGAKPRDFDDALQVIERSHDALREMPDEALKAARWYYLICPCDRCRDHRAFVLALIDPDGRLAGSVE